MKCNSVKRIGILIKRYFVVPSIFWIFVLYKNWMFLCCLYVLIYLYLTLYSHKKTSVPLTVFREKRGAYNALKQRKLTTWGVSLIWGLRKMKFICNAIFSIWYFFSYLVIMYTWINRIVYGEKCLPTNILRITLFK